MKHELEQIDIEHQGDRHGYVAGVFDLLHVGHLALFRRAKEHCGRLTVGVLSDDLALHFKGRLPIIGQADRMNMVAELRSVDDVFLVEAHTIDKIAAWEALHFDVLFSGDDHRGTPSWVEDDRKLRERGSRIEFFGYTPGVSSSQIRASMAER